MFTTSHWLGNKIIQYQIALKISLKIFIILSILFNFWEQSHRISTKFLYQSNFDWPQQIKQHFKQQNFLLQV